MDSFLEEFGSTAIEFMFLYIVYRILYQVLVIVWGLSI